MIGHNYGSLSSIAQANVETGVYLLCKEALVSAIADRRLDRMHLCVLACIVEFMNTQTAKAFPDRVTIASILGVKPVSVSNKLRELRELGYLIGERERVPEAGHRSMMVYTFGHIDHETIRREITSFIRRVRDHRDAQESPSTVTIVDPPKSPSAVTVTEHGDFHASKVTGCGDSQSSKVTEVGDYGSQESPGSVTIKNTHSIEINNNNIITRRARGGGVGEEKPSRASRLSEAWKLPRSWGVWALDHFVISPDQVRTEAASFKDYWTSQGNTKNAAKSDWQATWRNWIRNSKKRYLIRKPETEAAPDLLASKQIDTTGHEEVDYEALRRESGIVVYRGRDG